MKKIVKDFNTFIKESLNGKQIPSSTLLASIEDLKAKYEPGAHYSFDELPEGSKGYAIKHHQVDDYENGTPAEWYYTFLMVDSEEINAEIAEEMGPEYTEYLFSTAVVKAVSKLNTTGLINPRVGSEVGNDAAAFVRLEIPMPYFSIIKFDDPDHPEYIEE